jgi:hypothetical protein
VTTSADVHRRLLDTAHELVAEFDSLPAGTVLRCFYRTTHQARLSRTDPTSLPLVARRLTRTTLASRLSARAPVRRNAARIAVSRLQRDD